MAGARYVIGALALAAFLAPPAAQRARRWAGLAFIGHAVARRVPRTCRERVDAALDGTDDLERTLRDLEYRHLGRGRAGGDASAALVAAGPERVLVIHGNHLPRPTTHSDRRIRFCNHDFCFKFIYLYILTEQGEGSQSLFLSQIYLFIYLLFIYTIGRRTGGVGGVGGCEFFSARTRAAGGGGRRRPAGCAPRQATSLIDASSGKAPRQPR